MFFLFLRGLSGVEGVGKLGFILNPKCPKSQILNSPMGPKDAGNKRALGKSFMFTSRIIILTICVYIYIQLWTGKGIFKRLACRAWRLVLRRGDSW